MVSGDFLAPQGIPILCERSRLIADALLSMTKRELQALWKCSDVVADRAYASTRQLATFDWLNPTNARLTPALFAYEGLQYQSLAPRVLSERALAYLQRNLRILSGFYGVVKPLDGVVPYRLEMQAKLSVDGCRNLYQFWGDALFREVTDEEGLVVNLASAEYARTMTPFFGNGRPCALVTCSFYENDGTGRLVSRAAHAKAARGSFVRWCAENNIESAEDLPRFDVGYRIDEGRSSATELAFVRTDKNAPSLT